MVDVKSSSPPSTSGAKSISRGRVTSWRFEHDVIGWADSHDADLAGSLGLFDAHSINAQKSQLVRQREDEGGAWEGRRYINVLFRHLPRLSTTKSFTTANKHKTQVIYNKHNQLHHYHNVCPISRAHFLRHLPSSSKSITCLFQPNIISNIDTVKQRHVRQPRRLQA